jgi:hypothetical protein
MLVKGWLQKFDCGCRKYTIAHLRAQERGANGDCRSLNAGKLLELATLLGSSSKDLSSFSVLTSSFSASLFICHLSFGAHSSFCLSLASTASLHMGPFYTNMRHSSLLCLVFSRAASRPRDAANMAYSHYSDAQRIASAISFHNRRPLPQGQQADADAFDETTQRLPSHGVATLAQSHNPNSVDKSNVVPRSRSGIDPHTRVHVPERLVTTTAETVENIAIFLEQLDQPVKGPSLWPEKWKGFLHITFRLLRDQSTFVCALFVC